MADTKEKGGKSGHTPAKSRQSSAEAAQSAPAATAAGLQNLTLTDRVIGVIALVVIVGWCARWLFGKDIEFSLFQSFFQTLSFCGAMAVASLVGLKLFGMQPFSETVERRTLAAGSLLPVVGYLVEIVTSLGLFMTIGGSIALAYISATTYWRQHIPEFAKDPLGKASRKGSRDSASAKTSSGKRDQSAAARRSAAGEEEERVKELAM